MLLGSLRRTLNLLFGKLHLEHLIDELAGLGSEEP
jgi:hypothetical protein